MVRSLRHLRQISEMGDRAHEFVSLYQTLIEEEQWKFYVSVQGILPQISALILKVSTENNLGSLLMLLYCFRKSKS